MRRGALCAALTGVVNSVGVARALDSAQPGGRERWERTNFAGRTVSLTGGAATALGVVAGSLAGAGAAGASGVRAGALASAVAAAAGGLSGLYDDLGEVQQQSEGGGRPPKGLRGHLGALRQGRLTTGATKILGIGAGAAAASLILGSARGTRGFAARSTDFVVSSVLIAGTANLLNLLDLRPGRALKSAALLTGPVALCACACDRGRGEPSPDGASPARGCCAGAVPAAATLAAVAAAVPADLGERTMLGDTGANALGAACGVALAAALPARCRMLAAAGVVGLTLASERVSFSKVIDANPVLSTIDGWGRLK